MGPSIVLKHCFKCILLLVIVAECKRFSSRGGGWGRPSSSRHSPSRPSSSHRPSPSQSHPNPVSLSYGPSHDGSSSSASRPIGFDVNSRHQGSWGANTHPAGSNSPNFGFNSGGGTSFGSKPATHQEHVSSAKHVGTSNAGVQAPPIGFKNPGTNAASAGSQPPSYGFKPSAPQEHATNTKPLGTSNTASGGAQPPPYGFKPSAPVGPPTNVKPVGNSPYPVQPPPYTPHNPGVAPPAYNPAYNPAGYGPPPPAYTPGGYGQHSGYGAYPQQQYHPAAGYHPYAAAPGGITNVNINNYNTHTNYGGGGFGGGFGGYPSYPSYHYSHNDVGSGTLGFFLGYSLAKLTTPTFHYASYGSSYTPRYDHYEVHHYYHNKASIPAQSTIQPNTIVGCVGDSGTICPSGTTSLCTNNGAILCVASATSTVPCSDQKQGNCVKTVVPCVNGTGDCSTGQNKTLSIPCISSAKVMGNITYVNNTIIVNNTTIINNNTTIINNNTTMINNTTSMNSTAVTASNTSETSVNATVTTTEVPTIDITTAHPRTKRETPVLPVNDFCVTILALPAQRKPTEQEKLYTMGTSFFSKFLVKAFGANNL